jgi:fumarate hydratase subunit alpha
MPSRLRKSLEEIVYRFKLLPDRGCPSGHWTREERESPWAGGLPADQENVRIAREEQVAICQDTGLAVLFVELGQEVHIVGETSMKPSTKGPAGLQEEFLRKSSCHPFTRSIPGQHSGDYPLSLVPRDKVKVSWPRRAGAAENMSTQ